MLGGLGVSAGLLGSGLTILGAVIGGVATLLGAGSAASTLVIARAADNQALRKESQGVAHAERTPDEARELLGSGD